MKKINIGIIGAGRIGRLHAENLTRRVPEARVLSIADIDLEAARKCAAKNDIPESGTDSRVIIENSQIDAVIICSSTDTHYDLITACAAAGKHVFCEKPVDLDLKRIDEIIEKTGSAGIKFQIGFNRRFDRNFKKLREEIAGGVIGKPQILRITSRDPGPPPIEYIKVSGGIFLDMTIHDFDMARYLIDCEVEELYTSAGVTVDPEIGKAGDFDTSIITLKFTNGTLGTIDNCRQAVYGYDQRVEILGPQGLLSAENESTSTVELSTSRSVERDLPYYFFIERYTESYITEMREFLQCIAGDQEPPVTGIDGKMAVVLGMAAALSQKRNGPVKLSEITQAKV